MEWTSVSWLQYSLTVHFLTRFRLSLRVQLETRYKYSPLLCAAQFSFSGHESNLSYFSLPIPFRKITLQASPTKQTCIYCSFIFYETITLQCYVLYVLLTHISLSRPLEQLWIKVFNFLLMGSQAMKTSTLRTKVSQNDRTIIFMSITVCNYAKLYYQRFHLPNVSIFKI